MNALVRLRRLPLLLAATVALALPAAWAQPQPLERYAPADAVLALGLTPGGLPDGDLMDALETLDLDAARAGFEAILAVLDEVDGDLPIGMRGLGGMGSAVGGALEMAEEVDPSGIGGELAAELDAACPGLGEGATAFLEADWASDLLASIVWDPFSSIPGAVLLARVEPASLDAARALNEQLVACFGGETLGETAGVPLHLLADGSDLPLVVAVLDDLFIVGTQPEPVRAVLSRAAGSGEASLADRPGAWTETATGARLYYDLARVADVVANLVPLSPDDPMTVAVDRGLAALRTIGSGSARLALTDAGIDVRMTATPNADGGDPALYDLLTCAGCVAPDAGWTSADAIAVQGVGFDLGAWVDWLDGLTADVSGAVMGTPMTLRELAREQAGLDLDLLLLDWLGGQAVTSQFGTISTDLRDLIATPSASILSVTSAAAAEAGLDAIEAALDDLAATVATADGDLADLQDVVDQIAIRDGELQGVPYRRVQFGPTTDLRVAVVDDRMILATTLDAFETALGVLDGTLPDGRGSAGWAAVSAALPTDASGWSYGDGGAPLDGLTAIADLAAQPAAAALAAGTRAALEDARREPVREGFGFEEEEQPLVVLDASTMGYAGPDGIVTAPADELIAGVPVDAQLGPASPTFGFDTIDVYRLERFAAGTEVSIVMTSEPLDTYLYLYDAATGQVLAENDDAPWTDRSEIRFESDGRDLLVGATSWGGGGEGPYRLEVVAGTPVPVETPAEPEPTDEAPEVVAPSFAELLPVTEIVPQLLGIVAERTGLSWSVRGVEDGSVVTRSLQTFDW
jgi:hypothetical protein